MEKNGQEYITVSGASLASGVMLLHTFFTVASISTTLAARVEQQMKLVACLDGTGKLFITVCEKILTCFFFIQLCDSLCIN